MLHLINKYMVKQIKELYCDKAGATNNLLFDVANCINLIDFYLTKEPNVENVKKYIDKVNDDLKQIGKTHQQEFNTFEMLRNYCLTIGRAE